MGRFALPLGDDPIEILKAAKANIDLLIEDGPGRGEYLFGFARSCLDKAEQMWAAEVREGR